MTRSLPERARLVADAFEAGRLVGGVPAVLRELAALADRQQLALDVAAANADRMAGIIGEQAEALRLRNVEIERLHEERFREAAEQQLDIERLRGCLLWLLWHHQGASSPNAPMTEAQIEADQWLAQPPAQQERKPSAWAGFLGADLDKRMAPARELVAQMLSAASELRRQHAEIERLVAAAREASA